MLKNGEPVAPRHVTIVVARSDGSFETWCPIPPNHPWFFREKHCCGSFYLEKWSSGRWGGLKTSRMETEERVVAVVADDARGWRATRYAIRLAARMSGVGRALLRRLDRSDDGQLRCPYCRASFKLSNPFADHLAQH